LRKNFICNGVQNKFLDGFERIFRLDLLAMKRFTNTFGKISEMVDLYLTNFVITGKSTTNVAAIRLVEDLYLTELTFQKDL